MGLNDFQCSKNDIKQDNLAYLYRILHLEMWLLRAHAVAMVTDSFLKNKLWNLKQTIDLSILAKFYQIL